MLLKKYCRLCGEPFEAKNASAKYCSPRCGDVMRDFERRGFGAEDIEPRVCEVCGATFWTLRHSIRQVCGRADCMKQLKRHCKHCGREFTPRKHAQKYCCEACHREADNQARREKTKGIFRPPEGGVPRRRSAKYSRTCHDCGKPTDNYRCEKCLRRWRLQHGVRVLAAEDDEGYKVCRSKW